MTRIEILLRQYRWQLDERRQRVGDLDQLAQKLRREAQRLAGEAVAESVATEDGLASTQRIRERRETIEQSLAAVEQELVESQEAANRAHQELARHEIVAARQVNRQRARSDRPQDSPSKLASPLPHQRSGRSG